MAVGPENGKHHHIAETAYFPHQRPSENHFSRLAETAFSDGL
ncbi:hypothetical protein [Neisseria lisongii]|nr:hypothetical protein [Neisseria lisongii]